jgi:hypothetical protein
MTQRFKIEDLIAQDSSGVVYCALDTATSQFVALRRFFPFGANGGGLQEDEQAHYDIATASLSRIKHPAMRSIICGGCDPADAMPYIATEWIDGTPLRAFLERGALSPAEASHLIGQALEVCELLSQVLTKEAVWVETDVQTIIVADEGSGRGITFWISPLAWLGKNDAQRGMESIINLTEEIMGWRGKLIHDHDGQGLGAWLKWLRSSAKTTTLRMAREKLAATAAAPPILTKPLTQHPSPRSVVVAKKRPSRVPFFMVGIGTLLAIPLGGGALSHWSRATKRDMPERLTAESATPPDPQPDPPSPTRSAEKSVEQVNRNAAALTAAQTPALGTHHEILRTEDSELLLNQLHQMAKFEGTLEDIRRSGKGGGKTIYLYFSGSEGESQTRGGIEVSKAQGDLAEAALAGLKGKKLRIEGSVRKDGFGSAKYPVVMIENRGAIQEVP